MMLLRLARRDGDMVVILVKIEVDVILVSLRKDRAFRIGLK